MRAILFFLGVLLLTTASFGQGFQGPTDVNQYSAYTYTYSNGTLMTGVYWETNQGIVEAAWSVGTTYYASVQWTVVGSAYLTVNQSDGYEGMMSGITVNQYVNPISPPSFSPSYGCESQSLTLTASPGNGGTTVRWYNGAGALLATGTSYTTPSLSNSITYYISSYNESSGAESSPKTAYDVTINPYPNAPSILTPAVTRCGPGAVTLQAAPNDINNIVVWYANASGGSYLGGGYVNSTATYSPTISVTTTYYISTYNVLTHCELPAFNRIAITATINPIPNAAANGQTLCSGQTSSISITNPNAVSGTVFNWTVGQSNVSGASSGIGANISQALSATTNAAGTAIYTITPTANGCTGSSITAVATVNPIPVASGSPFSQSVCTGTTTNISLSSNVVGTTFNWTASGSNAALSGFANGSGASIAQTITNSGNAIFAVTYTVVPTANGCLGNSIMPSVTVAPRPTVSASNQTLCSEQSTNIIITNPNNVPGTTFSWTSAPINVTGSNSGSGSTIAQPLTSLTGGSVTYSITASANGCIGTPVNVLVTVNPLPATPSVSARNRFDAGPFTLTATGAPVGGSYNWYSPTNSLLQGNSATYVTPTVSSSASNYTYAKTVSSAGCLSSGSTWASLVMEAPPALTGGNRTVMGANVTLDAGPGYATYDWRNSSNTTLGSARTFSTNVTGDYTVRVTKTNVDGTGVSSSFTVLPQLGGLNENYILTNTIQANNITDPAQISNLPAESNSQTIAYFDGLGRPMQTVSTQGSPNKKDMVQTIAYDAFGRESKKYLPVVTNSVDGWYKPNLVDPVTGNYINQALNFYNNGLTDKISDDTRPFSETIFEPSPLNRPDKDFGTGQDWYTSNKHVKHGYLINVHGISTGEERIIAWRVANGLPARAATALGYVEADGYYSTGQLNIKSTKDEQGNEVREYVDKEGRTILKKVQAVGGTAQTNNDNHWAMTYYIYDDFGNLSVVLPPEAVKAITAQ